MSWLLTILGIIVLIVLHELGHFAVAKAVGMRVERFSLFFPPTLLSVKRGETTYAVGALPLGGYVKITGMSPEEVDRIDAVDGRPATAATAMARIKSHSCAGVQRQGCRAATPVTLTVRRDGRDV